MNTDELIAISTRAKDFLAQLMVEYRALPNLLDREIDAVRKRSMSAFEELSELKNQRVTTIVTLTKELVFVTRTLSQHAGVSSKAETISILKQSLEKICLELTQSDLNSRVLVHVFGKVSTLCDSLLELKAEIQPKIEFNKTVIGELLISYQQSQRFWQEVVAEIEATYSPDGKKRGDHAASSLIVQA